MKKQYTKKQIQEAIKYWTERLKALDESKIKVIDDLIAKFGKDIVLSKDRSFTPTTQELRSIYDILNHNLFNNELKPIPVTYCNSKNIADRINIYNAVSNNDEPHINTCYGRGIHLAASKDITDNTGKVISYDSFDNIIMLNSDYLINNIFIFIVACLCHEMIHYCDSFSDELKTKFFKSNVDSTFKYDSHEDAIFKNKMKLANENGINVVTQLSPDDKQDALRSRIVLKNVFGENEEFQDTEVKYFTDIVFIRNKRTGRGTFIQVD